MADKTEKKGIKSSSKESSPNVFARLLRFLREVVAELRKVIWPTRRDLIRYTLITIVFVSVLVAFVAFLDVLLARGVLALFGDPNADATSDGAG